MLLKVAIKVSKIKEKKPLKSRILKNNLKILTNNLKPSKKHFKLSKQDTHQKPNKTKEKIKNTVVNLKILNNFETS